MMTKIIRTHSLGTINVYMKFHGNSSDYLTNPQRFHPGLKPRSLTDSKTLQILYY